MKTSILLFIISFVAAHAGNLVYQSPYTPEDAYTFSSKGGKDSDVLTHDVYIHGIKGGEITKHESLTVTFDYPVIMQNLQVGLLFAGDSVRLVAGSDSYLLEAYGFNSAHYLKNGVLIANLTEDEGTGAPDDQNLYGMWTLHDPFGSSIISSFTLSAPTGDFGLMSFNTLDQALVPTCVPNSVPEAVPTIGVMLMGVFGIAAFGRRAR